MTLNRYKIGQLITQRREKYNGLEDLPVRGVTRDGFIPPKQPVADKSIYNVFYKGDFVFNPARMELNSIAYNGQIEKGICSSLYEIFYVSRPDIILPEYLNMFVKRDEFARKCWFNAIGSARNYFRVPDLSEFEIDVPSVEVQKEFVDLYNGLCSNLTAYEKGSDDLKMVCEMFIEKLRRESKSVRIGDFIELSDLRNKDNSCSNVKSVSTTKYFNDVGAKVNKNELRNYKIVKPGEISYVQTTGNEKCLAFAINDSNEDIVVTSVNNVFKCKDGLNPYYLGLWFRRKEFDRFARFISWGSARETVSWDDLCEVKIPIPSLETQNRIVECFNHLSKRRQFTIRLRKQLSSIAPILLKGSISDVEGGN